MQWHLAVNCGGFVHYTVLAKCQQLCFRLSPITLGVEMKRWENGQYIELTPEEEKEVQQRAALAAAEEAEVVAKTAARQALVEQLRQRPKSGASLSLT